MRITTFISFMILIGISQGRDIPILRSIRECIRSNSSIVCLKERALKIIDEAVASDQPLQLTEYVDIVRDPSYQMNLTEEESLPRSLKERSEKLTDLLSRRVDEFFESRTLKLNLAKVFEGIYKYVYNELDAFYQGTQQLELKKDVYKDLFGYYNKFFYGVSRQVTKLIPDCLIPVSKKY